MKDELKFCISIKTQYDNFKVKQIGQNYYLTRPDNRRPNVNFTIYIYIFFLEIDRRA